MIEIPEIQIIRKNKPNPIIASSKGFSKEILKQQLEDAEMRDLMYPEGMHSVYESVKAEKCRRSLPYFMREFWSAISGTKLIWNWHIDFIGTDLMETGRLMGKGLPKKHDTVINIPPGTTKSITTTVMYPVWLWLNYPWLKFITASYTAKLALDHAGMSKDIMNSYKFKRLFPELRLKRDKQQVSYYKVEKETEKGLITGGARISTSLGRGRGGTVTGFHGHGLFADDIINPQGVASDKERKAANDWLTQSLYTRMADKDSTVLILIMQRLHEDDCSGHVLSSWAKDEIRHICLPGEIWDDASRERVSPPELVKYYKDGMLDVNRLGERALGRLQSSLGHYGYAGQILQNPAPPEGSYFDLSELSIIDAPPHPSVLTNHVRYWDKAGTAKIKNPKAKFTCGVHMAYYAVMRKYVILDVLRGQWAPYERENVIRMTAEADGVETVQWIEQEPADSGKESAQSTIGNLHGFIAYADRPTGNKINRADPFSVQVKAGNVLLVKGAWNKDYIEELKYFPNSRWMDQVDASSGAFSRIGKVL